MIVEIIFEHMHDPEVIIQLLKRKIIQRQITEKIFFVQYNLIKRNCIRIGWYR